MSKWYHPNYNYLVTTGSAAWFGPHRPSRPLPIIPVRPIGFLQTNWKQLVQQCTILRNWHTQAKSDEEDMGQYQLLPRNRTKNIYNNCTHHCTCTWGPRPLSHRGQCDSSDPLCHRESWTEEVSLEPVSLCAEVHSRLGGFTINK